MKILKHIGIAVMMLGAMLVLMIGLSTSASAETFGDLTYTVSYNREITITGCSPSATGVAIPSIISGYNVTRIESQAFLACSSITNISLPASITSIGSHAFFGCSSLTSINIPDGVTSIGNFTFYGCSSLPSIIIPDSVTSIGTSAFENCSSLKSIIIPDSVRSIGKSAFKNCQSIENVFIENIESWLKISLADNEANPMYYGSNLYVNYSMLTELTIPDSITSINDYTLSGCNSLTNLTIPDSVSNIGYNTFFNCSSLENVYIECMESWLNITFENPWANPIYYCDNLYFNNELLTELIIPDSATNIGNYAFLGCQSLTSVIIPDGVTNIGVGAFFICSSLTSITIPDSVTRIGESAFEGCSSLENILYTGTCEQWNEISIGGYNSELTQVNTRHADVVTVAGKDATCTATGLTDGVKCSVCDTVITAQEIITKKAHTKITIAGKDATCTETGLTDGSKCSVCDTVITAQKTIAKISHTTITISGKNATCTEIGLTDGAKCTVCGTVIKEQELIEKLAHTEITISGKDSTCTESGLTSGLSCSVCNIAIKDQEIIPAKGHTETIIPGKNATCTESGLTGGAECSACNIVTMSQEIIPALGHDWINDAGMKKCNRCDLTKETTIQLIITADKNTVEIGDTVTYTVSLGQVSQIAGIEFQLDIPDSLTFVDGALEEGLQRTLGAAACGFNPDNQKVVITGGMSYTSTEITPILKFTCKVDRGFYGNLLMDVNTDNWYVENIYGEVEIELVNDNSAINTVCEHPDTTVYEAVSPSCTETGLTDGEYCSVCDTTIKVQEIIPAKGHTFGDWTVIKAPTGTESGIEESVCSVCEEKETRTIETLKHLAGDVNSDGKITAADARIILRISAKLDITENYNVPFEVFDVTGDRKLTAADARKVLRISAKLEKIKLKEYRNC